MKDKIGQEIKIGDFVAYGCAIDRSAGLQIGKVIAFGKSANPHYQNGYIGIINESGAKTRLYFPERMVVITNIFDGTSPIIRHGGWSMPNEVVKWD